MTKRTITDGRPVMSRELDVAHWATLTFEKLKDWSADERCAFFDVLSDRYCRNCGRELQPRETICHCTNDE